MMIINVAINVRSRMTALYRFLEPVSLYFVFLDKKSDIVKT